jgi:hypothetical protein
VVAAHGGSNRYESNTGVMLRRMEFMSRPRKPAAGLSRHKPLSPHEVLATLPSPLIRPVVSALRIRLFRWISARDSRNFQERGTRVDSQNRAFT